MQRDLVGEQLVEIDVCRFHRGDCAESWVERRFYTTREEVDGVGGSNTTVESIDDSWGSRDDGGHEDRNERKTHGEIGELVVVAVFDGQSDTSPTAGSLKGLYTGR